jgi:hypothetical protein
MPTKAGPYSRSTEKLRRPEEQSDLGPVPPDGASSYQIDFDKLFGESTRKPGPMPRDGK